MGPITRGQLAGIVLHSVAKPLTAAVIAEWTQFNLLPKKHPNIKRGTQIAEAAEGGDIFIALTPFTVLCPYIWMSYG